MERELMRTKRLNDIEKAYNRAFEEIQLEVLNIDVFKLNLQFIDDRKELVKNRNKIIQQKIILGEILKLWIDMDDCYKVYKRLDLIVNELTELLKQEYSTTFGWA